MDLAGERNLKSLLEIYKKTGGKLEEILILFYCAEILRIVDFMHSKQIIHGDLSPSNIVVADEEESEERREYKKGGWCKKVGNIIFFIENLSHFFYLKYFFLM